VPGESSLASSTDRKGSRTMNPVLHVGRKTVGSDVLDVTLMFTVTKSVNGSTGHSTRNIVKLKQQSTRNELPKERRLTFFHLLKSCQVL